MMPSRPVVTSLKPDPRPMRRFGGGRVTWGRSRARWATLGLVVLACAPSALRAEVVRIEIFSRQPADGGRSVGAIGPFEILRGRAYGEIDPDDAHNRIVQDLALAPRNERGRVEYAATFALAKPVDMSKSSRVLLYRVVNRGHGQVGIGPEGDISLISGWQGDVAPTPDNQTVRVPVARNPDGWVVTGPVLARFVDVPDGTRSVPIRLGSYGSSPQPYLPADLGERSATLTMHATESPAGVTGEKVRIPRDAWAFADCRTAPFPGTPDPTRLCVAEGLRPDRVYELVYTAKDPLVLGLGLLATRDVVSFFRYSAHDEAGRPNPVAGGIDRAVAVGDSQSGNLIKSFVHLGFNQDEGGRIVWDGVFPRIAARQTPINFRFALPGGAAALYEPGSEGVLWWGRYDDRTRGLGPGSLLERCMATRTCPKVIEAFGSTELWGLRMSPGLVGTDTSSSPPRRPWVCLASRDCPRAMPYSIPCCSTISARCSLRPICPA
jgi:hypothetical protein